MFRFKKVNSNSIYKSIIVRVKLKDITEEPCDAIVSSANNYLSGSVNTSYWMFNGRKNVETRIFEMCGSELSTELASISPAENRKHIRNDSIDNSRNVEDNNSTIGSNFRDGVKAKNGDCVVTKAYGKLPCRYIYHVIAPRIVFEHETEDAKLQLQACYHNILSNTVKHSIGSITIPAIGCGIAGWNPNTSAQLFVNAMIDFFDSHRDNNCSSDDTYNGVDKTNGFAVDKDKKLTIKFCMIEKKAHGMWLKQLHASDAFEEMLV